MNSEYSYTIIARERQADLAAEAAANRLARIATAGRTPWWQRLGRTRLPRPAHSLAHRVAH